MSRILLEESDLARLRARNGTAAYLNDNLIQAYLELIVNRSRSDPSLPKVLALDSFLMPKIFKDEGFGKNPFAYDVVLIPVCEVVAAEYFMPLKAFCANNCRENYSGYMDPCGKYLTPNHWTLIVLHARRGEIAYLDSLSRRNEHAVDKMSRFFQQLHLKATDQWINLTASFPSVPTQMNNFDCGLFMLKNAELLSWISKLAYRQSDITAFCSIVLKELTSQKLCDAPQSNVEPDNVWDFLQIPVPPSVYVPNIDAPSRVDAPSLVETPKAQNSWVLVTNPSRIPHWSPSMTSPAAETTKDVLPPPRRGSNDANDDECLAAPGECLLHSAFVAASAAETVMAPHYSDISDDNSWTERVAVKKESAATSAAHTASAPVKVESAAISAAPTVSATSESFQRFCLFCY